MPEEQIFIAVRKTTEGMERYDLYLSGRTKKSVQSAIERDMGENPEDWIARPLVRIARVLIREVTP